MLNKEGARTEEEEKVSSKQSRLVFCDLRSFLVKKISTEGEKKNSYAVLVITIPKIRNSLSFLYRLRMNPGFSFFFLGSRDK